MENYPVSRQTRNEVWQGFLDVVRLVRYYETLSDKHRHKHSILQIAIFVFASGEVMALLIELSPVVRSIWGGLIALLVVWGFVADYAKKAAVLHIISNECCALEIEWRELWAEINNLKTNIDDAKIMKKNKLLEKRMLAATERAGQADIRVNKKLNEKCAATAYKVMEQKYAL